MPSVQFIDFSDERQVLLSPDEVLSLEKVDPVTLFGFAPVPIAYDKSVPEPGRNVTVVGYGSNSSWDVYTSSGAPEYPGVAIEVPLQVQDIEYCEEALSDGAISHSTVFCAAASHANPPYSFLAAGPCYGTRQEPPGSLSSTRWIDRLCGSHADPIASFACFE